ncbi:FAD-binding domain-containing protein [Bimuria novae-zelandiae CBS 107.79]|uniref:FAD-binding domain-containing protein n=1 Tax=Bimuria novae-zelandiae CBS 107.79 TaxID=1447943 RepID=A0A6A5VUU1_9PLEO|nr:FAD-binding domain-containing protein [Bimuria novae-zelandiae CBS 107.79]
MLLLYACFVSLIIFDDVVAYNFPYEGIQLSDSDVANNPDIAFGKLPGGVNAHCKTFPGDSNWPSVDRWNVLNASLEGALLRVVPPAAACYSGIYEDATKCALVRQGSRSTNFVKGVFHPVYALINSFRNTGHDYLGRNTRGGALKVYVHRLKAFEYLPSTKIGNYQGKAARVGAALEQYELFPHMEENNITMLAPGSSTVGAYGGYMQGGGFSYITSKFGLMADQVLALEVVTADGRFVHADPENNKDLFWTVRGGGPSE